METIMRTRIVLFLLSCVIVFGCAQQAEDSRTAGSIVDLRQSTPSPPPAGTPCTEENPCVTVHEVILDGYCPDDVILGSQDVVKFVNRSGKNVRITGLDNTGKMKKFNIPVQARLSGKPTIVLSDTVAEHGRPGLDSLGYLQVLKNPFRRNTVSPSDTSLTFQYQVRYRGKKCVDQEQRFWSVPPSMIVGPDTL